MIPKIIHYCWLSQEPYPPLVEHCLKTWKQCLPDYEFRHWGMDSFPWETVSWTRQALECGKYAFVADFVRVYALYTEGGIYLDTDVEVLKSFDPFLEHKSFMGWESCQILEAAVVGSEPGQKWLENLLEYYKSHDFVQPDGTLRDTPMPVVMQKILEKSLHGESFDFTLSHPVYMRDLEMMLYPYDYFSPKDKTLQAVFSTGHTVCIHHFNAAWMRKNWIYHLKLRIHRFLIRCWGREKHDQWVNAWRRFRFKRILER